MQVYITKKELLEQMNISYGQLYRWKRLGLIPESWFIKKPSSTGQETILPRKKIWKPTEWQSLPKRLVWSCPGRALKSPI